MYTCQYCNSTLTSRPANHVRWCKSNPQSATHREEARLRKLGKTGVASSNQYIKAREEGKPVPSSPAKGTTYIGRPHTEASKKKMSTAALASPHRRLVRSVTEYTKLDGTTVKLDSSWEVALAKALDVSGISWERPYPLKWVDSDGSWHHYFPDFYLPEYQIYLDPKGPLARKAQEEKIKEIEKQYGNVFFLYNLDECINFDATKIPPCRSMDRTTLF